MLNFLTMPPKTNITALRQQMITEINRSSDDEFMELYRFILYFRLGWARWQEIESQQRHHEQTFESWLVKSDALSAEILQRRQGVPLDIDALWEATREELEARDEYLIGD